VADHLVYRRVVGRIKLATHLCAGDHSGSQPIEQRDVGIRGSLRRIHPRTVGADRAIEGLDSDFIAHRFL
jgi:hypothetical protein